MTKKEWSGKGHAVIGSIGRWKTPRDVYIRSFYGYIAVQDLKKNMGDEDFWNQIVFLKEKLIEIAKEDGVHAMDCIDTLLDTIESKGLNVADGIFNSVILASIYILMDEIS